MKNINVGFVILSITLGAMLFFSNLENERLKTKLNISDQRQVLNDDMIKEMEWRLSSARTYDEGFHDAIMYGQSKSYVDGYHRAIGQNQEQIQHLQAVLEEKNKELKMVVENNQ